MSQFIFPPLTASLDSEASDGGSLPSAIMIVGGYDGANTQVIKTDADGNLQVDILSSSTITVTGTVTLGAGTAAFGKLSANSGVDIGDVDVTSLPSIPSGSNNIGSVGLESGTNTIGKLAANSGVDIGDVTLNAGTATIGKLAANSGVDIGDVTLNAGTAEIGKLAAGTAAIGKLVANSGVDIGDVDVTSIIPGVGATNLGKAIQSAQGTTDTGVPALVVRNDTLADLSGADGDYAPIQVNATGAVYTVLSAGTAVFGKLAANSGVDIGDVTLNAGTAEIGKLAAGTASIGTVILGTGSAQIGKLAANSGVDIGDVDVTSLPALASGTNTIGKVDVNAIAPVDFLDAGVFDASTGTNIPSTGSATLVTLAAACTEIEVVDDIGEYMSLRVGGAVKAYLPLGGGRVKVTLAATNAVTLYSETGTTISSGKIAINFLG